MKKKPLRQAGRAGAARPQPKARPRGRTLLVIDNAPIREEALRTFHQMEAQLAKLREELESFESGDLPAFRRWEAVTLGPFLTELRELSVELEQKRELIEMIEEEIAWTGCSRLAAYRRVLKALKEGEQDDAGESGEPPPPWEKEAEGAAPPRLRMFGDSDLPEGITARVFDAMPRKAQKEFRELYAEMAALFSISTGLPAPDLNEVLAEDRARHGDPAPKSTRGPGREKSTAPEKAPADRKIERIKELYRQLVRMLHPDHHGEQTARERELWHQVQEAYHSRNLERLEALFGRLEVGLNGATGHISLHTLMRMAYDMREALRSLRNQLSQSKTHPAWNFRKKTAAHAKMAALRQRELRREIQLISSELEYYRRELKSLAEKADRPARNAKSNSADARAGSRRGARNHSTSRQGEFGF